MDRIRKAMEADERSSAELARLAKVHPVNLRQFKARMRDLPLDTLVDLAKVLGLEITVVERPKRL